MNRRIISILLVVLAIVGCLTGCTADAGSIAGDVISVDEGMLSFDDMKLGMKMSEAKEILEGKGYELQDQGGATVYCETVGGLEATVEIGGTEGDTDTLHIIVVSFNMPQATTELINDKSGIEKEIKNFFSHGKAFYQGWGDYLETKTGQTPYGNETLDIPGIEINTMAFKDGKVVALKERSEVGENSDCSLEMTFAVNDWLFTDEFMANPDEGASLVPAQMQLVMWTTEAYNSVKALQ